MMMSEGISLKQISPFSFRGLCPFHEDKNPSLHVNLKGRTWLWNCFGCDAGGDLIKFVMKRKGMNFTEAVEDLLPKQNGTHSNGVKASKESVSDTKVLREVANYYHEALKTNKRAQEYLKLRGLLCPALVKEFKLGFSDGTLPRDPELLNSFKRLGILNHKGEEHFRDSITFPIEDEKENTVSLYGRHILKTGHLYLKGAHQGVFNGRCVKASKRLFIAESIIDCLSLIQLGLRETIALFGTYGFTEDHRRLIADSNLDDIYLCLDNDEAGKKAVERLKHEIPESIRLFNVSLPEGVKDPNEFLLSGKTKEELMSSVEEIKRSAGEALHAGDFKVTEEAKQILFSRNGTQYRVKGLSHDRFENLKVTIKVSKNGSYHLDSLDLYQARGRQLFSKMSEKLIGIKSSHIERDLKTIIDCLETKQTERLGQNQNGTYVHQMTGEEKRDALAFLKDPHLMERITTDAKLSGHVGEEDNFLLGYLIGISRKLKEPLGLLVISQSGAGKSALQDKVIFFTPPEDCVRLTRLTDQSLFYQSENALVHKLLAIEEEEGAQGASYSIRHLLSGKDLDSLYTGKDEVSGEMASVLKKVKGGTSVMVTTTHSETNRETYSRFVVITVDESRRQTMLILKAQRKRKTLEGTIQMRCLEKLKTLHHNAQRLLRPLEVVNPYAEKLHFTDNLIQSRREQPKYLTLMDSICLLRQYQKEVKTTHDGKETFHYIEVDTIDIKIANRLAREFLIKDLDQMTPQARRLLKIIREMVVELAAKAGTDPLEVVVSRRQIRDYSNWTDYQLRKVIEELAQLEYLIPVSGKNGKRFTYQLIWDGESETNGVALIDPDTER